MRHPRIHWLIINFLIQPFWEISNFWRNRTAAHARFSIYFLKDIITDHSVFIMKHMRDSGQIYKQPNVYIHALDINWPNIWSFHVLQPTFISPSETLKQKRQVWINYTNPPDWNRSNNIISSPKPNDNSSDVALGLVPIYLSTSSRDGRRLKSQKTVWYNDY